MTNQNFKNEIEWRGDHGAEAKNTRKSGLSEKLNQWRGDGGADANASEKLG